MNTSKLEITLDEGLKLANWRRNKVKPGADAWPPARPRPSSPRPRAPHVALPAGRPARAPLASTCRSGLTLSRTTRASACTGSESQAPSASCPRRRPLCTAPPATSRSKALGYWHTTYFIYILIISNLQIITISSQRDTF